MQIKCFLFSEKKVVSNNMERINEMLIEEKRINIEQMRVNEEQKRINEELMSQLRQMQMEIIMENCLEKACKNKEKEEENTLLQNNVCKLQRH